MKHFNAEHELDDGRNIVEQINIANMYTCLSTYRKQNRQTYRKKHKVCNYLLVSMEASLHRDTVSPTLKGRF